jgi:hypothetical protein
MARRKILAGSTSVVVPIFIQDSSSTTGAGLGSLVYNSSGLAAKYRRQGESSWTTISLVTATAGTFTSSGFVADGGPVTGGYELGVPNAALASGATWVQVAVYGATNMLAALIEIELDAVNYQDATRFGLSALPNANAGASGGLPLSVDTSGRVDVLKINGTSQTARDIGSSVLLSTGTGTGQLDFTSGVVKSNATQIAGSAVSTTSAQIGVNVVNVGGTVQTAGDIYSYVTTNIGALGANLSAIPKTGFKLASDGLAAITAWTVAITGNITGNLSGSIGSYTGNTPQTGDAYARLGAPAGASTAADIAAIKSETDTILTDVNTGGGAIYTRLGAPAGASIAADIASAASSASSAASSAATAVTQTTAAAIRADVGLSVANLDTQLDALPTNSELTAAITALLTTQMTEAYAADGTAPTLAQCLFLIQQSLHEFSISGTARTVKKLDGATTAAVFTLDSATSPTSTTRTT